MKDTFQTCLDSLLTAYVELIELAQDFAAKDTLDKFLTSVKTKKLLERTKNHVKESENQTRFVLEAIGHLNGKK